MDENEADRIVGFGLSLFVADGEAMVEHNGQTDNYVDVLPTGKIAGQSRIIELDSSQLAWLAGNISWVNWQLKRSE